MFWVYDVLLDYTRNDPDVTRVIPTSGFRCPVWNWASKGGPVSMHMLGGAVDFELVLLVEGVDQHKAMQYYEFYDQFRQFQIVGWRPYIQLYDEQDDPIYTRLIQNNPDRETYPSPEDLWPMFYGAGMEEIVYDRGHFDIRPITEYQYPVDELD